MGVEGAYSHRTLVDGIIYDTRLVQHGMINDSKYDSIVDTGLLPDLGNAQAMWMNFNTALGEVCVQVRGIMRLDRLERPKPNAMV